ncbi:MAG: pyridoxal 5'-phosphate synthase glutaminase subunit PdxT [Clostridia bacterium]|nr:pyridoxal 5'-phosphate synthase glutaminase subunit PdxT [Clostridia bacterium]
MVNVGVLALQGSVIEHVKILSGIEGVIPCEVRTVEELDKVSGLILPGGESTTIGKLLKDFEMAEPIKHRVKAGMPVWGTCAGMILMAKKIVDEDNTHLELMDITVRRNAYGSQLDSFSVSSNIPSVSDDSIPMVFIRAPWVECIGSDVEVLAELDGRIVAVKESNMLATSFHPELSANNAFHKYFVKMIENNR